MGLIYTRTVTMYSTKIPNYVLLLLYYLSRVYGSVSKLIKLYYSIIHITYINEVENSTRVIAFTDLKLTFKRSVNNNNDNNNNNNSNSIQ